MKKSFFIIPAIFIFLFSCNNSPERTDENEVAVNKKEIVSNDGTARAIANIGIEGMTCQAGCARNIQNRLSKMAGVVSCEVSFDSKNAVIEYDDSKVAEKEMIATIREIHGGQYKVTSVDVEKFIVK